MYWNIKVYDSDDGSERETIRGLNATKKDTLMRIFDREGIQAQAMQYNDDGEFVEGGASVNWPSPAPAFDTGDEVVVEKTASVPTATVEDISSVDGELHYTLAWSNGKRNQKPVEEIDRTAMNS